MAETYTTHDVARFCGVYPSSVVNWIKNGRLKSFQTVGGHHRVNREELLAFMRRLDIPIPAEVTGAVQILIVDDDVEFARALKRSLSRQSDQLSIELCHDGVEALIRIGQSVPRLVILDMVLPRMDGPKVCSVLKSNPTTSGIVIVAVTGKKLAPAVERKLAENDVTVLRKPLDMLELGVRVVHLLGLGHLTVQG